MPQLDLISYPSQLFWLFVTFGIMYLVVAKVAVPGIGKILRARQDRIISDLDEAERMKEEAKSLKQEYQDSLRKTKLEANEIISKAASEAYGISQEKHGELDATLEKKFSDADKKLSISRNKATEAFTPVIADLTRAVVAKLTNISVSEAESKKHVEERMKGIKI